MINEFDTWLQTIPTFKNQQPRTLDSFRYGEQFEDDLFPATPDSFINIFLIQMMLLIKIKKKLLIY